ncbi:MAG: hypothetical protein EOO18_05785, partial [Chryseobacterium sp.]
MKFLIRIGFLALILLLTVSCTSTKNTTESMGNIHRKWMLVEYKDFAKPELVKLEANMDLTKINDTPNRYIAKMGCNGMFFTSEFDDGKAKFSGLRPPALETRSGVKGPGHMYRSTAESSGTPSPYMLRAHRSWLSSSRSHGCTVSINCPVVTN